MKYIYVVLICSFIESRVSAQDINIEPIKSVLHNLPDNSIKALLFIKFGDVVLNFDQNLALEIYHDALELSEKIDFSLGCAKAHHYIGNIHYFTTNYVLALEDWKQAEVNYLKINDFEGIANTLSNSGAIYYNQNEHNKALDLYLRALTIAEKIKDKKRIATIQQNIGAIHTEKLDHDKALMSYKQAMDMFKEIEYVEGYGLASLNIGVIYKSQGNYQKAMEMYEIALIQLLQTPYHTVILREMGALNIAIGKFNLGITYLDSALIAASKTEDLYELSSALNEMAEAYSKKGDTRRAIELFLEAKANAFQIDSSNFPLMKATSNLLELYASQNDYFNAFENQKLYQQQNDSKFKMEKDKKFNTLLFNFELEKKEGEIELLSLEQEIQKKEVSKQKIIRNAVTLGLILVIFFAVTVFIQRNRISKEKERSEELLLNILPEETAKELKEKGHADAQLIEQVSVLFTDFKGFTSLSEKLSPKELVKDLHECFSAFDGICEKYGIEKIKTIGDAYMAAGGLPTPNNTHAEDVVRAALEISAFVELGKQMKIVRGEPFFEIRVGVHTGPVVAGIVGVKKFQYDIWGDTVNTASRMESSGAVGKVNISQSTYEIVKDKFDCEFRGQVEAKGKGKLNMYFVENV